MSTRTMHGGMNGMGRKLYEDMDERINGTRTMHRAMNGIGWEYYKDDRWKDERMRCGAWG